MKQKRVVTPRDGNRLPNAKPDLLNDMDKSVQNVEIRRLGDFASLRDSLRAFKPFHNMLISDSPSDGVVQLGNFSRIVNQLRKSSASPVSQVNGTNEPVGSSWPSHSADHSGHGPLSSFKATTSLYDSEREIRSQEESHTAATITPATTPPTPSTLLHKGSNLVGQGDSHIEPSKDLLSLLRHESKRFQDTSHVGPLVSYRLSKMAPVQVIWAALRSEAEMHESLAVKLVVQRTYDRLASIGHPEITGNGIHVFLDMSNIDISFHSTLRLKYNLADTVRFTPLPQLNLDFLSEILTRGRPAESLIVGCSMKPGYREPQYIQRFRDLGYHVDLRTRRKIEDVDLNERPVNSNPASRYVEDLVDETLQTRIGEAVMEYYKHQGTIVLATGDAKPAQYSDGFLVYVDRALKMGWNVEVVSWRCSLSEAWRELKVNGDWGDKFRIIELDDYLDELLACYT